MKKSLISLLLTLAPALASAAPPTLEQQYAELTALDDKLLMDGEPRYDLQRLAEAFDQGMGRENLAGLPTADVGVVFRAARFVAFRTDSPAHVQAMRAALDELQRRGEAAPLQRRQMAEMYLAVRDVAAAAALNRQLPADQQIDVPALVDELATPASPTVLRLGRPDGRWQFVREAVDLRGPRIVVVASPACGFSRAMFESAAHSPELAALLRQAVILLPQTGDLLLDEVSAWNRANPDLEMRYVHASAEWPMIGRWATPTIFLLDDGKVSATLAGWQPEISERNLLQAHAAWRGKPAARP